MKKIILALVLLLMIMGSADARMSGVMISGSGTAGEAPAGCTTPTGDEVTESWGEGSTSCWSTGSSVCNNTWTISGTLSIENSPGSPPDNTACAKSLKADGSSAAARATLSIPGGAIAADEAVTINFSVYVDSTTIPAWGSRAIVGLNNASGTISAGDALLTVNLRRGASGEGSATHIVAYGATDYCELAISEDTWYDVTVTLAASDGGDQSEMSIAGGSSCVFTKDTDASAYLHAGISNTAGVVYIGNLRLSTP